MSSPAERKAVNEGVFRDANEHVERGARELIGAEDGGLGAITFFPTMHLRILRPQPMRSSE